MEKAYQKNPQSTKLKARANKEFLRLILEVSVGGVDPASLTPDIYFRRKKFLTPKQLQALIVTTGQRASFLVDSLAPRTPPYLALKSSLKKVYPACSNGQWVTLAKFKKPLQLGVQDPAVVSLKNHLVFLGYPIPNLNDVVDQETVNAINDVEWNLRIKPDGTLAPGGAVWKFLNTPCLERVRQIQADMEKMRWLPQQFEDRYIFINLAMAYFILVDKTQNPPYVSSFRTINGRAERKTPTMRDTIVRVILNPFWVVPPTIFIEDKVKEIRELKKWQIQHYFDSNNYEVWNREFTKRIKPDSINWWAFDSKDDANIYIRQRPNFWNALGVVKFDLTNSGSIYLHDTGQRDLFYEAQRLLSSGCIRLERPLELAEYLLRGTEWDRAKIESSIVKPGEVKTRDTHIRVKDPIPVYTVFLTSFLGSDNILRFTEDSYGQNDLILKGLKAL
jgi:murein L,D-transpeptidase YcbB/YkuD